MCCVLVYAGINRFSRLFPHQSKLVLESNYPCSLPIHCVLSRRMSSDRRPHVDMYEVNVGMYKSLLASFPDS